MKATRGDERAFAQADAEAHAAVAAAAHNAPLQTVVAALSDVLRHSRAITAPNEDLRRGALTDLRAVARAIRAGDATAAERAMREHLTRVGKTAPRRRPARSSP